MSTANVVGMTITRSCPWPPRGDRRLGGRWDAFVHNKQNSVNLRRGVMQVMESFRKHLCPFLDLVINLKRTSVFTCVPIVGFEVRSNA
ncbi:hypothetical protein HJFPF1_04567 [Paramyrothecium foliicola]|nr:hypothetical protein HJFPF1_04567 [Paramyrothecium foliicola]